MAHKPGIWTGEVRRVLYKRLVQEFGASTKWKKSGSPGQGLDAKFDDFCKAFAKAVGASSGEAVKQQIRFALPETDRGSLWDRQVQTAILNKAAALEAGFITDGQLPNLLAVDRSAKGKSPKKSSSTNKSLEELGL